MLIDTHCHVLKEYYDDCQLIIDKMKEKKVIGFISGTDNKNNKEVIQLAIANNNLYATVGFHPSEANNISEQDWYDLEEMIKSPYVIAAGEMGLDYYWTKDNIEKQKEVFIRQIRLAKKYNKPIIIHNRDAMEDVYEILKNENASSIGGIMHCYNGSLDMAKQFIDLNFLIAVGGIITFKNAKDLKDVIKGVNIEYIVLETDSPYLAPEPFRGKDNEPSYITYIVDAVAALKNIGKEQVIAITTANVFKKFNLKNKNYF